MQNIKTSDGVEKYVGQLRLLKNGLTADEINNAEPMDESALPHFDEVGMVMFKCADGQTLYQAMSLSELNLVQRNYVWRQIAILLMNVELKRKRFYTEEGHIVLEDYAAH